MDIKDVIPKISQAVAVSDVSDVGRRAVELLERSCHAWPAIRVERIEAENIQTDSDLALVLSRLAAASYRMTRRQDISDDFIRVLAPVCDEAFGPIVNFQFRSNVLSGLRYSDYLNNIAEAISLKRPIGIGRPSLGEVALLLAPTSSMITDMQVAPGAALVGFINPKNQNMVTVYYEGDIYNNAEPASYEDMAVNAYGRMAASYPTVAMLMVNRSDVETVGLVSLKGITIEKMDDLLAWIQQGKDRPLHSHSMELDRQERRPMPMFRVGA